MKRRNLLKTIAGLSAVSVPASAIASQSDKDKLTGTLDSLGIEYGEHSYWDVQMGKGIDFDNPSGSNVTITGKAFKYNFDRDGKLINLVNESQQYAASQRIKREQAMAVAKHLKELFSGNHTGIRGGR